MEHADPLPLFSNLLREEYLWSEEYDEEEDEMRYEEDEVFPDDLFYSFYYYSCRRCWPTGIYWSRPRRSLPSLPPQCWNCCKGGHTMFEEFYEMYEPRSRK